MEAGILGARQGQEERHCHSPPDETYETQGAFDEPPGENDICPDPAPPDDAAG